MPWGLIKGQLSLWSSGSRPRRPKSTRCTPAGLEGPGPPPGVHRAEVASTILLWEGGGLPQPGGALWLWQGPPPFLARPLLGPRRMAWAWETWGLKSFQGKDPGTEAKGTGL